MGGWYKDLRKERPPFAPPIHPDSSLNASKKLTAFTGLFGSYDSHRSCFPRSLAIPPNHPLGMTETMNSQRTNSVAYTRVSSLPIVAPRRKLSRNDSRGSILVIGDRRSRWCLHSAFVALVHESRTSNEHPPWRYKSALQAGAAGLPQSRARNSVMRATRGTFFRSIQRCTAGALCRAFLSGCGECQRWRNGR